MSRLNTRTDNAPLAEMSIALQFADRAPFGAFTAKTVHDSLSDHYPVFDVQTPIAVLGGPDIQAFAVPADQESFRARWWFSNESGSALAQMQDDLVAFNWRNRVNMLTGAPGPNRYPGYAAMKAELESLLATWCEVVGATGRPMVAVANIYYDNVWGVADDVKVGEVFAFWKTMGIQGRFIGPDIKWQIGVDHPALTPASRIDLSASMGSTQIPGMKPQRAARLTLGAYGYLTDQARLSEALDHLHDLIHKYLAMLTTNELREAWNE